MKNVLIYVQLTYFRLYKCTFTVDGFRLRVLGTYKNQSKFNNYLFLQNGSEVLVFR